MTIRQCLHNKHILLASSESKLPGLQQCVESRGGIVTPVVTLAIAKIPQNTASRQAIQRLAEMDIALFTSPNAVYHAAGSIRQHWAKLPQKLRIIAQGAATASALIEKGLLAHYCAASPFTSEALLAMEQLQGLAGKRVIMFKGCGGRQLLAQTLVARGARVVEVDVYERYCPTIDPSTVIQQLAMGDIELVIATSGKCLSNLVMLLKEQAYNDLQQLPLLVISERVGMIGKYLGFQGKIRIAENATNDAIIMAILQWFRGGEHG